MADINFERDSVKDPIETYKLGKRCQEEGEYDDALIYFDKSIKADSSCPYGWYGMSSLYLEKGLFNDAFATSSKGIKIANTIKYTDSIYNDLGQVLVDSANKLASTLNLSSLNNKLYKEIESKDHYKIYCKDYNQNAFSSYLGYGPDYNVKYHNIVYNSELPDSEYRILHELIHLDIKIELHKKGINLPYKYSYNAFKMYYQNYYTLYRNKYRNSTNNEIAEKMANHIAIIFATLITNIVDLYIEKEIYDSFTEIRPIQLLSTIAELKRKDNYLIYMQNLIPEEIYNKIIILNQLGYLNFEALFGIRQLSRTSLSSIQFKKAKTIYNSCTKSMEDRNPREQIINVINFIAEQLNINLLLTK